MLLDIGLEALAAILDADFLSVVVDLSVASAEAASAILTLSKERFTAATETATMIAARRLAIFANLHAVRPSSSRLASTQWVRTHRAQASAGVTEGAPRSAPGAGPVGRR